MPASRLHCLTSQSHALEPFLLLDENRFAKSAIRQISVRPFDSDVHLVFIFGPSGTGKSHLAQRFIGEQRRRRTPIRISQFTACTFAAQFAEAAELKQTAAFRQMYRDSEIMICEDIHVLEERSQSQWQLLWLLDDIVSSGGRVLVTSRRPVGDLRGLLPRLANRLRGGLCAAVLMPDFNSRVKLISHFAQRQQLPLPADAVFLLAETLPVSPRELLATMLQLETLSRLTNSPFNLLFVSNFLKSEVKPVKITVAQIARSVAQFYNIRLADMRSHSRAQGLLLPRQCAMYLARQLTGQTYAFIAQYFGSRNHSTVVHACNRVKRVLPNNPGLRQQLLLIQGALSEKHRSC